MTNDELTPQERKAMEALPRERTPSAVLKARTLRSLRQRGIVRDPRRRYIEVTPLRTIAAAAACVMLVVSAFAFGQFSATDTSRFTALSGEEDIAASVQRASTAYVAALENLGRVQPAVSNDAQREGREVALSALYAVADETVRLIPDDDVAHCIRRALHERPASRTAAEDTDARQQVIWF